MTYLISVGIGVAKLDPGVNAATDDVAIGGCGTADGVVAGTTRKVDSNTVFIDGVAIRVHADVIADDGIVVRTNIDSVALIAACRKTGNGKSADGAAIAATGEYQSISVSGETSVDLDDR